MKAEITGRPRHLLIGLTTVSLLATSAAYASSALAEAATSRLQALLNGHAWTIETFGIDGTGNRRLATIRIDGVDVGDILMKSSRGAGLMVTNSGTSENLRRSGVLRFLRCRKDLCQFPKVQCGGGTEAAQLRSCFGPKVTMNTV
ncbi:hypothetical protein [Loktanella sp. SALINAS62]|uniref:hypothetical protein n=1 Tax=Loktanella sp. SALINAS62 TaxID=2706124 RepID=UPI001B8BE625|nr:hypothetical protein [Loktanella sp. SALINAS62]MBS1303407.1 hypothetical protein [Loktanella sp. SALINAS62]